MSAIYSRPTQPIHSPRDRERLQIQLKHLENRLQGKIEMPTNKMIKEKGLSNRRKSFYEQFQWKDVQENQAILKRQIERAKQILARGQPRPMSRTERGQVEKQRQLDAEFLKKNLTPKQLYYAKPNTPEFNQGKKVCRREISNEIQSIKDRYIQATRRLDPDNDSRDLIESLRPGN